jgi:hypothetical protein
MIPGFLDTGSPAPNAECGQVQAPARRWRSTAAEHALSSELGSKHWALALPRSILRGVLRVKISS